MSSHDAASDDASRALDHTRKAFESALEALSAGKKAVPDLARDAQRRIGEHVETLRGRGGEVRDQASDRFDEAREYVVDHVQERPLTATLLAIGVGFVLGLLFSGER